MRPIDKAIELVAPDLGRYGIAKPRVIQRGGFANPDIVETIVLDKPIHSAVWQGSYEDKRIALALFEDAMCALWGVTPPEVHARIERERSLAQR